MSSSSSFALLALLASAIVSSTAAAFTPGVVPAVPLAGHQVCGVGCVTGLIVMAFIIITGCAFITCCIFWPSPQHRLEYTPGANRKKTAAVEAV